MTVVTTNIEDWDASDTAGKNTFADAVLTVNVPIQIGEYTVPPNAMATVGGAKGFLELFDDTTTAVREDGTLIFYAVSSDGSVKKKIYEMSTRTAGASGQLSTPSEWQFYPVGSVFASGTIELWFKSDAADTFDSTDHSWIIPITLLPRLR